MLNIAGIFKNRVLRIPKLGEFGFAKQGDNYSIAYDIMDKQFCMNIVIKENELPAVKVIDKESKEEYVLIHTPGASGSFVGEVVMACEEKLAAIAENCYDYEIFKSRQAKEIIAYVDEKYHNCLEYLWKKFPDNAVFRRTDTEKWYAVLLTVAKEKIGIDAEGTIEIIDLRGKPEQVGQLIDGQKYFPGYHMNKKNWYTICLNDTVDTQEIFRRIDVSFLCARASKGKMSAELTDARRGE